MITPRDGQNGSGRTILAHPRTGAQSARDRSPNYRSRPGLPATGRSHRGYNAPRHYYYGPSSYSRGYRDGLARAYYHSFYRYYGARRVFGLHFGGFGFHAGAWHFVLVIGQPYVYPVHRYYDYSWWNGRYATLMTWDRARTVYPSTYFADGALVRLLIRTQEGVDYSLIIDPALWGARDPGELYAALWGELDQNGELQIQDVNGAIHVFPAGMIQQIEAYAYR